MKPIVLIHGYSAESPTDGAASITGIYGDLPQRITKGSTDLNPPPFQIDTHIGPEVAAQLSQGSQPH